LREIFRFLKEGKIISGLDQAKADKLREGLGITNCVLHEEHSCDYVEITFQKGSFVITEDGIILVKNEEDFSARNQDELAVEQSFLREYYVQKLSPAIDYLFSMGAPISRSFKALREVSPFIVVASDISREEIDSLNDVVHEKENSVVHGADMDIHNSSSLTLISLKNENYDLDKIEEFIKQAIFFREIEIKLEEYLTKHRIYWDELSKIRNSKVLRLRDFPGLRDRLGDIRHEVSYIKTRLLQMDDILSERSYLVTDEEAVFLRQMGFYRFKSLEAAINYTDHLLEMTLQYLDGTIDLLHTLYEENTQREFSVLKTITFAGAIAGFFGMNIGFPWEDRWGIVKNHSYLVAALVIIVPVMFYLVFSRLLLNRRFKITEKR